MFRRLLTVLSVLSLTLCVATVVLWVRSFRVGDELARTHSLSEVRFGSLRGLLCVAWGQRYQGTPGRSGWRYEPLYNPEAYDLPYPSGLEHAIGGDELGLLWGGAGGIAWHVVVCPDWLLCLLLLLLPARPWFRAYCRWRAERSQRRD
jgi:hypothetical protein